MPSYGRSLSPPGRLALPPPESRSQRGSKRHAEPHYIAASMGGDSGPVQLLSQPIGKVVQPHVPGRPSAPGDRLAVTVGSRADPTVAMAFGLFFFLPSCRLPPPGRASTAVARKSTEMRSIASFIVWTLCLRTGGQGDGASDDQTAHACAGRCVVRVWSVCGENRQGAVGRQCRA